MNPNQKTTQSSYTACFGPDVLRYAAIVRNVLLRTAPQIYSFMPTEEFEKSISGPSGLAKGNQIYWTEMLHRAHLASCTSLRRNLCWIEAACLCHDQANYLGFSASLRGFIESVGDSAEVLLHMPENIARDHSLIKRCIDGCETSQAIASREMEDELIGYSHARHITKKEQAPLTHKAKQTQYYVKWLSEFSQLGDLQELYKDLCEVMHPASSSVLYQFSSALGPNSEVLFKSEPEADRLQIELSLRKYTKTVSRLVYFAFDPGLITLRVLHRFALFPQIPELRKFDFWLSGLVEDTDNFLRK